MTVVWAILLVLVVVVCWALSLLGLPGNWLIAASAAVYTFLVPDESQSTVWWIAVGALVLLAIVGELLEMLASAVGVRRYGGSRRGAVLSLVGAMIGAIFGAVVGTALLPVVGSILGALLLASAGALLGAFLGEQWKGKGMDESLKVGHAAFWGRLAGTVGKMALGCVMVAIVLVAIAFQFVPA